MMQFEGTEWREVRFQYKLNEVLPLQQSKQPGDVRDAVMVCYCHQLLFIGATQVCDSNGEM